MTVLCDAHVGEAFPPRCEACDALTAADAIDTPAYPIYKQHIAREQASK